MTSPAEEAHKRGITLSEATKEYAPPRLRRRFAEIDLKDSVLDTDSTIITPPLADGTVPFSGSLYGRIDEGRWLRQEMRTHLIDMLTAQKLAAVGRQAPEALNPTAVWISSDLWAIGEIEWASSALHTDSESYSDVRIVPTSAFEANVVEPSENHRLEKGEKYRKAIIDGYRNERDDGKINFKKSLRANMPIIQAAAAKRIDPTKKPSDIRGIKYETIRKVVGEQFKRDGQNLKGAIEPPK